MTNIDLPTFNFPPLVKGVNEIREELTYEAIQEQLSAIQSIATSAESEVSIMREQLILAKSEAEDAKKDALLARIISIVAIVVSGITAIGAIIVPLLI